MMTLIRCIALAATLALCQVGVSEEPASPIDSAPAAVRVTGQLRAIKLLKVQSLDVPWTRTLTVARVVQDLGGFTEFASYIVITSPGGERMRYPLEDFDKVELRNTKLEPGARVHVGNRD